MTSTGLQLRIENVPRLPDGGPLAYALSGARGLDIGRDSHLDWCLPDPDRHISGKHCEIRYQNGAYLLYDVSRNGTFLNGGDNRMQSPHRLRSGDRLLIGNYIVAVEVEEAPAPMSGPSVQPPAVYEDDPWGGVADAAAPGDPRDLRPPAQRMPSRPDFLEWAVDIPNAPGIGFVARQQGEAAPRIDTAGEAMNWDAAPVPPRPAPEPAPAVPTPRRPLWVGAGPEGPWHDPALDESSRASRPEPQPAQPTPVAPRTSEPAIVPAAPETARIAQRFARGAGLLEQTAMQRDGGDLAEWLGRLMLLVTDNLKQLLDARGQTKKIVRSSSQTTIAALDNNPLKFSPTAADALQIMVGPSTPSYLVAETALQQVFDDLKTHQLRTFSAMQQALAMLLEEMEPKAIDAALGPDKGLARWFGSRKARLWAAYELRWRTLSGRSDKGAQDRFMQYFAECYDRAPPGGAPPRRAL